MISGYPYQNPNWIPLTWRCWLPSTLSLVQIVLPMRVWTKICIPSRKCQRNTGECTPLNRTKAHPSSSCFLGKLVRPGNPGMESMSAGSTRQVWVRQGHTTHRFLSWILLLTGDGRRTVGLEACTSCFSSLHHGQESQASIYCMGLGISWIDCC